VAFGCSAPHKGRFPDIQNGVVRVSTCTRGKDLTFQCVFLPRSFGSFEFLSAARDAFLLY
jgi:hypothetical protein